MNELEKAVTPEETARPLETAPETAAPVAEVTAETSVVTDEDPEDPATAVFKRIHSLSKPELVAEMKEIIDQNRMEANREVTALKQAFYNIRSREALDELQNFIDQGNAPESFSAEADPDEAQFKLLYADFKEKRAAFLAEEEVRKAKNLEEKNRILDAIRAIAADIDTINTKFPEFQQLQADFKAIKDIPASAETDSWKAYQATIEEFYDHLKMNKELRDLDFKKNLEAKRALIEDAKALEANPDTLAAFRGLQELHNAWREIGPVAKELREEIWEQFKAASTVINKRHQDYFEQRKAREAANEEGKSEIISQLEAIDAETLKSFANWDDATKKVIELQQKWKEFGFASKKANNALYNRFRELCDAFFEAKTNFYKKVKGDLSDNLAKKTALVEKAEALKDETDLRKATDEIVKLQAEWKKIGAVPRKLSDALWQRFTEACNYFFEQRRLQNSGRRQEENANLAAKKEVIEALKAIPKDADRRDTLAQVRKLQQKWGEIGFVPFKVKDKIFAEYRQICDELYDGLSARESRERFSNFKNEVEGMKGDNSRMRSEKDRLTRVLEAKRNDLKTIENNLGFFNVKSSAGNSMVKEMERRVKRLKDEIAEVMQKIQLLDKK